MPDFTVNAAIVATTTAAAFENPDIACPAVVSLSPTFRTCSDAARRFTFPIFLNCPSKVLTWFPVTMISRCNLRYSSEFLSTPSASIRFCSFFKSSSFSFVSLTFCVRSCCFCFHSSTDCGLNLRALSTCFNSLSRFRVSLFIVRRALSSFVVSPRNSMQIPFTLPAIVRPLFAL